MNSKKIFLVIIFIILFIFISLSFLFTFLNNQALQKLEKKQNRILKTEETIIPTKYNNNLSNENWLLYQDKNENFELSYPPNYELSTIKREKELPVLNRTIYFSTYNHSVIESYKNCQGDCPIVENISDVLIKNYPAKKIKGWFGGIGGNIPHGFIAYEIKFPNKEKYFYISLNSIPIDASFEELANKYGMMGKLEISNNDIELFDKIVLTLKFNQ